MRTPLWGGGKFLPSLSLVSRYDIPHKHAHWSICWSEEAGWWERLPQKCLTRTRTDQNKVQFRKTPHGVRSVLLSFVQIFCKRVKLWLSRGKISTLDYRNQEEVQEDGCCPIKSIPIGCVAWQLRNFCRLAYWYWFPTQIRVFRAASTKILVVGEKMHFAYVQWMRNHASMRITAMLSCQICIWLLQF